MRQPSKKIAGQSQEKAARKPSGDANLQPGHPNGINIKSNRMSIQGNPSQNATATQAGKNV